jgi:hypothetical protein
MKRSVILGLALVAVLCGCTPVGTGQPERIQTTLARLYAGMPLAPGSTVLGQRYNTTWGTGNQASCGGTELLVLLGTNALAFQEVLAFYAHAMAFTEWKQGYTDPRGIAFDLFGQYVMLEVSDLYNVYRVPRNIQASGEYQTLFLLTLARPLRVPIPPDCMADGGASSSTGVPRSTPGR